MIFTEWILLNGFWILQMNAFLFLELNTDHLPSQQYLLKILSTILNCQEMYFWGETMEQ